MPLLSTTQLTQMRAQATASLDQTCTLTTPATEVDDAYGGTTPGTNTTASVACRVATPTGADLRVAERLGTEFDVMVTLPYGTTVSERCSVTVGTHEYGVVVDATDESYQTAVRLGCKRIT